MQKTKIIASRRFLSICIVLMLIFSLIPAMPAAAETGKTIYVTSTANGGSDSNSGESEASALASFEKALEKAVTGDTIRIIGTVQTAQLSDDSPLVISKEVTITGGELSVSHSGIILGNNVTFRDMALRLKNYSRNAIIANGYTLTMNNVTNPALSTGMSAASLHLFAGSLSDTSKTVPDMGPHGRIELYGKVQVGEIHAGSLSDVYVTNDYEAKGSNTFEKPVTIVFGSDLSDSGTIGDVYACGAREVRDYTGDGPSLGDFLVTDHSLYKNSGGVEIVINASNGVNNIKVHGKTGIDRNTMEETTRAVVTYDSSSAYTRSLGAIEDISKLHVKKGMFSLENDAGSAIGFYNTEIHVEGGALLQLKKLKLEPNIFAVAKYTGGTSDNPSTIILGKEQQFYITGDVSGTTNVAINYSNFPDPATLDYVYISAPASADGAFHLLPSTTQTGKDFVRNDKGEWSVPSQTSGIDISGASIKVTDDPETLICVPGGVVEPNIEVYLDGKKLGSEYYEVTYYGNNLPGEASIGIKGKNGYTGTAYKRFDILPANVTDTKYTQAAYTVSAKGETKTVTLPDLPHEEMEYAQPRDGNGNMTLTDLKVEDPAQADGKYQLSFTAPSGSEGQVGKIIVPVKVKNPIGIDKDYSEFCPYRNYELTATFTAVGDTQTELTIIGVALEPKTYDGSAPATVKSVEFSGLKNGDSLTVDTDYTVKASFDNFNAGENKTVTVTVTLIDKPDYVLINSPYTLTGQTITKATPSVKPEYEKITADGKTLADARLTKGSTYVEGTICWVGDDDKPLDNSTVVLKDKNYKWRFTPNDNENYNIVEKTVVLYLSGSGSGGGTGGGGSGGGGGGGGAAAPTVQRPTIEAGEGAKVTLSADGTTATITAAEGYEITDVTLNGVSKGTAAAVSGLKTGDKLTVTAAKKSGAITEEDQKKAEAITGFKPSAKSILTKTKSGKKAIRITWTKSEYDFDGVEVWRSTKKNSGYGKKPMWTIKAKNTKNYYNTAIKKGKTYYYKLRGYVEINGQKYYTPFSNKVYRTVK